MLRTKYVSRVIAGAAAVLLLASVAEAQKVKTDFDPAVNFGNFKTYFWVKKEPIPGNDIQNGRLIQAIDTWLATSGWKRVEADGDVALIVNVSTDQEKSLDTFYSGGTMGGWGYRGGWGGGMGMGTATTQVNTYTVGTLVVDLYDAATRKLVWRGTATDTLSTDPKKNAGKINKAAEKMFKKNFPPGVATKK